ncbi:hypothetical protein M0534_10185 [Methylonatrum kenyense]|uniref:hypothetical protein n=1 Tax=Methylonatrum kenyense TaxID=455253 RepID=UPI0020BE6CD1|nr:hypothetical protein [Methylonatrum kenyense]MCK8516690.1 hypothetical protein [Methylonatrum kenyense]
MFKRWAILAFAIGAAFTLAACNSSSSGSSSSRSTTDANLGDPAIIEGTFFTASGNGMSYRMDGLGWQIVSLAVSDGFASDRLSDFLAPATLPADATFSVVRLSSEDAVDISDAVEVIMNSIYEIDVDLALELVQSEFSDISQLSSSRLALRISSEDEEFSFRTPLAVGDADEPDAIDTSPLSELLTREIEAQALGGDGDLDAFYAEIDPLEISEIRNAFIEAVNQLVTAINLNDLEDAAATLEESGVGDTVGQVVARASSPPADAADRDNLLGEYNQIFFQTSLLTSGFEHLPTVTDLELSEGSEASELEVAITRGEQSVQAQFSDGVVDPGDFRYEQFDGLTDESGPGLLGSNGGLIVTREAFTELEERDEFNRRAEFAPTTRFFVASPVDRLLFGSSRETSRIFCASTSCDSLSQGDLIDSFVDVGFLVAAPVLDAPVEITNINGRYGTLILSSDLEDDGRELAGRGIATTVSNGTSSAFDFFLEVEFFRSSDGELVREADTVSDAGIPTEFDVPFDNGFPFGNGALELTIDNDLILRGFANNADADLMFMTSAPVCVDTTGGREPCEADGDDRLNNGLFFANYEQVEPDDGDNGDLLDRVNHELLVGMKLPESTPELGARTYRIRGKGITYTGSGNNTLTTAVTGGRLALDGSGGMELTARVLEAKRSGDAGNPRRQGGIFDGVGQITVNPKLAGGISLDFMGFEDEGPEFGVVGNGFVSADADHRYIAILLEVGDGVASNQEGSVEEGGFILLFGTLID